MKLNALFFAALCMTGLLSCAKKYYAPPPELSVPSLDYAFQKCAGTQTGKDYIENVSMTFLKTANFDSCILKGDPKHEPIAIYFSVDSVGKIGPMTIKPHSLLSYCIKENVRSLSLPPPPNSDCTVRIMVSFEGDNSESVDDEASPL